MNFSLKQHVFEQNNSKPSQFMKKLFRTKITLISKQEVSFFFYFVNGTLTELWLIEYYLLPAEETIHFLDQQSI